MAEINAEVNDILDGLASRIATMEKENAILVARLKNAADQIDELSKPAAPAPAPAPSAPTSAAPATDDKVHVVTNLE